MTAPVIKFSGPSFSHIDLCLTFHEKTGSCKFSFDLNIYAKAQKYFDKDMHTYNK